MFSKCCTPHPHVNRFTHHNGTFFSAAAAIDQDQDTDDKYSILWIIRLLLFVQIMYFYMRTFASFSTRTSHTYRCFIHERWNVFKFTDSVEAWSMCCITLLIHFGFAFHSTCVVTSEYNKYSKLQCRTHSQSHPLHYVWVIVCVCVPSITIGNSALCSCVCVSG